MLPTADEPASGTPSSSSVSYLRIDPACLHLQLRRLQRPQATQSPGACLLAARDKNTAILLFVDELRYVANDQLAALIVALHRCARRSLPLMLVGAGLPQLRGQLGDAKSYAERLFQFPEVAELDPLAAERALVEPAAEEGVIMEPPRPCADCRRAAAADPVSNLSPPPYRPRTTRGGRDGQPEVRDAPLPTGADAHAPGRVRSADRRRQAHAPTTSGLAPTRRESSGTSWLNPAASCPRRRRSHRVPGPRRSRTGGP